MRICIECHQELDDDRFSRNDKKCRRCRRQKTEAKRSVVRQQIADYKSNKGCCVCGESLALLLDFHHPDPTVKEKPVGALVSNNLSFEKVMLEVNKCVVLCSNHHRMVHAGLINIEVCSER